VMARKPCLSRDAIWGWNGDLAPPRSSPALPRPVKTP